ncbi:MAG: hypothetical protein JWN44_3140 [Myxococcales bacterium]|nr:hypothetical protein [Myxococcales bacterium]
MGFARPRRARHLPVASMRLTAVAALVTLGVVAALAPGCKRTDIVGTLGCATSRDCAPPSTICSADGRCVAGCGADPSLCIGGSSCELFSGECRGGGLGASCADDTGCDPPDVVCRLATNSCEPGCTVSAVCGSDEACNPLTGHCCTPGVGDCPRPTTPTMTCNSDSECPNSPSNICLGGVCAPGCAENGLCAAPLLCNPTTGHCEPATASCLRDTDCDTGSYCTQAGNCSVLAYAGPTACQGGTVVSYTCATKTTPTTFQSCVGASGPAGCPYCINGSCMHPGLCRTSDDCHGGDGCVSGLCRVLDPPCPASATVEVADLNSGRYAAGKEVCVRGTVSLARSGYDGMYEIKLGTTNFLYVDIEPMYKITPPAVGQTVTVHGTVRWDDGHKDRELLPVDWVGP